MRNPAILGIVSYKVFPAQMGGQKHIVDFYDELSQHTKVVLAVSKENEEKREQVYPVHAFLYNHWKGLLNLQYVFRLKTLIQQQAIDIVFIEHSYFGWLGSLVKRLTKKPFVIRSQNIETHRFRDMGRSWWWLYGRYEKYIHRKADHSFFITEEDRQWALTHWQLVPAHCSVLTYGMRQGSSTTTAEKQIAKQTLLFRYQLPPGMRLFIFNGSLDYLPNSDALRVIVSEILPVLSNAGYPFRLFVCGKGLDPQWIEVLKTYPEIIYTGFVEDISLYLMGADCFINPVTLGGGIRTKLVEALTYNMVAVSTERGASGIDAALTGGKLVLTKDYDWRSFAENMMRDDLPLNEQLPTVFRDEFNWEHIVKKALLSLQTL